MKHEGTHSQGKCLKTATSLVYLSGREKVMQLGFDEHVIKKKLEV
jgi:hypothetical protein